MKRAAAQIGRIGAAAFVALTCATQVRPAQSRPAKPAAEATLSRSGHLHRRARLRLARCSARRRALSSRRAVDAPAQRAHRAARAGAGCQRRCQHLLRRQNGPLRRKEKRPRCLANLAAASRRRPSASSARGQNRSHPALLDGWPTDAWCTRAAEAGGFALESAALDGSSLLKLSYIPGNVIPDDVLRDGRVLFDSGFPLGAGAKPEIYIVYADGTRRRGRSLRSRTGAARRRPLARSPDAQRRHRLHAGWAPRTLHLSAGRRSADSCSSRRLRRRHFRVARRPLAPLGSSLRRASQRARGLEAAGTPILRRS